MVRAVCHDDVNYLACINSRYVRPDFQHATNMVFGTLASLVTSVTVTGRTFPTQTCRIFGPSFSSLASSPVVTMHSWYTSDQPTTRSPRHSPASAMTQHSLNAGARAHWDTLPVPLDCTLLIQT